jgi:hypothetical protein
MGLDGGVFLPYAILGGSGATLAGVPTNSLSVFLPTRQTEHLEANFILRFR